MDSTHRRRSGQVGTLWQRQWIGHTFGVARDEGGSPLDGAPMPAAEPYKPGYEVMAERILQFIAELRLRPGDRMPTEHELAARLGTSRTVIREAVKILSALGRV